MNKELTGTTTMINLTRLYEGSSAQKCQLEDKEHFFHSSGKNNPSLLWLPFVQYLITLWQ